MFFFLNRIKKSFNKVTISLSGSFSRSFSKQNFNLKIKGGDDLYGRSHFKLRADAFEPTYLRSKLVSDIHNRLGLKSISAGYIHLYINDEFMGLYILTDSIKSAWIEKVYGEKKTTTLYKCDCLPEISPIYFDWCSNENDNVLDHSEWVDFLTAVKNASSVSDLENIFEIDHFLYEMAIEYLVFGSDHNYHNFSFYRQPNGKWIYLSFDFDLDFGSSREKEYNMSIQDYFKIRGGKRELTNILILNDPSKFLEIIHDVIDKVFNPTALYLHIDELKKFIKSSVEQSKIPDDHGHYPGDINIDAVENHLIKYSIEEWDAYSEFTSSSMFYGLKYWILMKYRYLCQTYQWECDPAYLDENYEYYINEEFNYPDKEEYKFENNYPIFHYTDNEFYYNTSLNYEVPTDDIIIESAIEYPTDYSIDGLVDYPTGFVIESSIEYPTESVFEGSLVYPTEHVTETSIEYPTESIIESSIEYPTESVNESSTEYSTQYQTEYYTSTLYYEKETVYEVDEPTFSADDESSFDEEDTTEEFDKLTSSASKITITKTKIMTVKSTIVNN